MRVSRVAGAVSAILAVLAVTGAAWAQGLPDTPGTAPPPPDRFVRHFTDEEGLPSDVAYVLAQDSAGFLWAGTAAGLARYGGRSFESVRPDLFGGGVHDLATSPTGALAVVERGRRELWISEPGRDFEVVRRPGGEPLRGVRWIRFDGGGVLWVIHEDGSVARRAPDGGWRPAEVEAPGADSLRFRRAFPQRDGSLLLTGRESDRTVSLWKAEGDVPLERLVRFEALAILRAAFAADGTLWLGALDQAGWGLHRVSGGRPVLVRRFDSRIVGLAARGTRVYVSHDRGLHAFDASGRSESIGDPAGIRSGGMLLVDREGSLWSGSPKGIVQFPEPEAMTWGSAHGLTSDHAEFVTVSSAGVWLSTWQGLGMLRPDDGEWRAADVQPTYEAIFATRLCVDGHGVVWGQTAGETGSVSSLSSLGSVGSARVLPASGHPIDCDATPDGRILAVVDHAVWLVGSGSSPEQLGSLPDVAGLDRPWVAAGPDDRVHVAWRPWACAADRAELSRIGREAWSCERLPDTGELRDLAVVAGPGGVPEPWVASFSAGVLRRTAEGWRPVAARGGIDQRATMGLAAAASGGIWVVGFGFVVRLDLERGQWRIVERIGGWHGVSGEIRALHEDPDGTIWLASWRGLTRVPPSARRPPRIEPIVRLAGVRADGSALSTGKALVPSDHRTIVFEFEASALRDPRRLRYHTRVDGGVFVETAEPALHLGSVAAGDHVVEVAATLDGAGWGPVLRVPFRVSPPWYARPWVVGLGLLLLGATGLGVHRLRTVHLVELERQRTRIAMDLHDELGAGLGSLGILGGLMAEDAAPPEERRKIGEQVARTAAELGGSLHDIVYSLRTGEARIDGLVDQLVTRGRTLFAGRDIRFTGPSHRPVPGSIAPTVSRQAYRIAVEALHNAARHSHASNVDLGIGESGKNGSMRLWVADDGCGIDASTLKDPVGMGLVTMRRRVEAIGGDLVVDSRPGEGTRIELRFHPFGRGGRHGRALRPHGGGNDDGKKDS